MDHELPNETGFPSELDRAIATEVFGWEFTQLANGNYYYVTHQGSVAAHGRWSPSSNAHAFDRFFQKIKRGDTLLDLNYREADPAGPWAAAWTSQEISVGARGASMLLAAAQAGYDWWKAVNGH